MATIKTWLTDFRDVLSPRFCATCGEKLNTTEQKICGACLIRLPYLSKKDFLDNEVSRLFWAKIPIERGHSYIYYHKEGLTHELFMKMKYGHRPDLCRWIGLMMARDLIPRHFFEGIEAIVPVPLHWLRLIERGYNQSYHISKGLSEVSGIPVLNSCVKRIRNNETQTHKTATERINNVKDVFQARSCIPAHHILLVDDVTTTGATLYSLAQSILKENRDMVFSVLTVGKAAD
ncbi:MAG: ComF family protein [Bacteroidaceae bacterium]|nr:ComF family protein [Bacteroidaceae bacterium]